MKLIGIVGRAYLNKDNQEIIQTHEAIRKTLMSYDDIVCITLLPTENKDYIKINPGEDKVNKKIDFILDKCDGFIIPGGTYYYNFDEYVIEYAIKKDKPLLAICLGFQILCSMHAKNRNKFQMNITANLENHMGTTTEYKHPINIKDNTLLKQILNKNEIMVNSVHHDIVNFELKGLIINALANDNIIEGVEYPKKKFIIGLQWHPEYLKDENSNKIIGKYISSLYL